jgi:tetratricopeptide (TPR) repeat protein
MRLILALPLTLITLQPALAQTQSTQANDTELCRATSDFERSVAACTRIIDAPGATKEWIVWAGYNRALAYDAKGDNDRALMEYDMVLRNEPGYLLAINGRGLSYFKKKDLPNAKAAFDQVLAFNPEFVDAHYSRGIVHFDLGENDKAIVDYTSAIALNPAHAAAYSRRGQAYEKNKEYQKAIADYRKALAAPGEGNIHQQAHAYSRSRLTVLGASFTAPGSTTATTTTDTSTTTTASANTKSEERAATKAAPVQVNLGRRVALIIGNAAYQHTDPLSNPSNDAREVAVSLRRLGFQTVIDGTDLDAEKLAGKVRDFSRALKGADLAFFYYAGHGVQVNGLNYMMPVDAKMADESDVYAETVELNDVLKHMERQAKTNIIILDACRNNPLQRNLSRSMGTRSAAASQGLAEIRSGVGTLIVFATQPGNVALDGAEKHSPFTAGLLKHLETPNIDIAIMLRRVRDDVIDSTKGQQVPWEHSSLRGAPVMLKAGP